MARFTSTAGDSGIPGPVGPQGEPGDPANTGDLTFEGTSINGIGTVSLNSTAAPGAINLSAYNGAYVNGVDDPDNKIVTVGDLLAALDVTAVDKTFVVGGGTLNGTQPTFSGTPLFTGSYVKIGQLVKFRLTVNMTNITGFGTGQYYMTLPFNAKYEEYITGGHLHDASTNKFYTVSAQTTAGSNVIKLWTTAPNGDEIAFTSSVPFSLAPADDFHVSGNYISE